MLVKVRTLKLAGGSAATPLWTKCRQRSNENILHMPSSDSARMRELGLVTSVDQMDVGSSCSAQNGTYFMWRLLAVASSGLIDPASTASAISREARAALRSAFGVTRCRTHGLGSLLYAGKPNWPLLTLNPH